MHVRKRFKIWNLTWFELTVSDVEVHTLSESYSAQFCLPYGLVTNSTHRWFGSQAGCLWNCHTSHCWQCLSICLLCLLCQLLIYSCSCTSPFHFLQHLPLLKCSYTQSENLGWKFAWTDDFCCAQIHCAQQQPFAFHCHWTGVRHALYLEPGVLCTKIDKLHCYNTSFYWFFFH